VNEILETDESSEFDPREAEALLKQTRRRAQRHFDTHPPLVLGVQALVIFLAYGGLWLSTRNQHPYEGPDGLAIAIVYGGVIVVIALIQTLFRRATAGVTGESLRTRTAVLRTVVPVYIAAAVLQGALKADHFSNAIVYGVWPAVGPMFAIGAAGMGWGAAREDWPTFGAACALVVWATGAAFAGPSGAWLVMGIGLFVAIVGRTVAIARLRRA
jgi:hypothetical protein